MADLMDDDRRCRAMSKQSGKRCKRYPAPGSSVCVIHGAASPRARAAAAERLARQKATALLEVIWDPEAAPVTDPIEGLQRLTGRLQHAADVLGARVSVEDLDGPTGLAWARVVRELRQALEGMERLGLAERAVELEAARIQLVVSAVTASFDEAALTVEQRRTVTRVMLAELRAGESATAPGDVVAGELE